MRLEESLETNRKTVLATAAPHDPHSLPAIDHEAEEKRLRLRLEELRQSLQAESVLRQTEALETLLSLLWVQEGKPRLLAACVLCGYSLQRGGDSAPPAGPTRLCARLERAQP